MTLTFTSQAATAARRYQPEGLGTVAMAKHARLLEVILALIAAVLGRRATRAWLHAPAHVPHTNLSCDLSLATRDPAPLHVRTPHDGTHLVCESPILYVIGPGPNRGLRPRPRAMPIPRARIARAPPRAPSPRRTTPSAPNHPQPGGDHARPWPA